MVMKRFLIALLALTAGVLCMAQIPNCLPDPPSWYPNIIINGGFEDTSMGLTGWKVMDQGPFCGSAEASRLSSAYRAPIKSETDEIPSCFGSWYVQTGIYSPMNGFYVSPPPQCQHAAMTDMSGPGTHVMYQDVAVPAIGAQLSFWYYYTGLYGGGSGGSVPELPSPPGPPADYFRVDLMAPGVDPFDIGPGVLKNFLLLTPGYQPPPSQRPEADGYPYLYYSARPERLCGPEGTDPLHGTR